MRVLDVVEPLVGRLEITVESILGDPACPGCGGRVWVKDRPVVELVDLSCFGRPVILRWCKHWLFCPNPACEQRSWTHQDPQIAAPRLSVTDRAGGGPQSKSAAKAALLLMSPPSSVPAGIRSTMP